MRILITGAAGFTAAHLAKLLSVQSTSSSEPNELFFSSLQRQKPKHCSNYTPCDLANLESVSSLINSIRPNQIYHLAGSFTNDYATDYKANVLSTRNLLDSLLRTGCDTKVLLIGSSAEYGATDEKSNPIKEDHPLKPISIYGLTKVYQTSLMNYYCQVHKLNIVMARTFNILGKGMSTRLFVGRMYEQIEKYKRGEISKITVGNLSNKRDYINIADAVKFYKAIMTNGVAGEIYNVGSGESVKIYDLLIRLLDEAEMTLDAIEVQNHYDTSRSEVADIYAEMSKTRALGACSNNQALSIKAET